MKASPAARKLAKEMNIDLAKVTATGPEGSVVEADVLGFGWVKASPAARKAAKDRGIDLGAVLPTGPDGRVVEKDVLMLAANPQTAFKTSPLAAKLAPDLGVDLLSVDFKVDLSKAAHELAGRTALAGNLNPVLLREGTPDSIARETTRILQEAGNWPRFVLMPGCDVPARVPLENLQTFFAIGRQWKKSAA